MNGEEKMRDVNIYRPCEQLSILQFHHTQMDGAHAARFLSLLQEVINSL